MKSLLLALFLLPISVSAQFNKGDKFIGGMFDFNLQRSPYVQNGFGLTKIDGFSIVPELGFLLDERRALGGTLGYSWQSSSFGPDSSQSVSNRHQFFIGLFYKRYYSINDKFLFTLNGTMNYSNGVTNFVSVLSSDKSKFYEITLGVFPSFLFFPSKRWGIEASIGNITFTHSKTITSDQKTDTIDINYGSFLLGFAYFFQKINITIN